MHLENKENIVNKPVSEIYGYLESPDKIKALMPDNVNKFEAVENGFVFGIQGVPMDIKLKIKDKVENEKIILANANPGLDFTLSVFLKGLNASQTMLDVVFEGNFNPMVKMMVQKPLHKFINEFSAKATKL